MSTAFEHSTGRASTGEVRRLTGPQSAAIAVFRLSGRPALEVAATHLQLKRPRPLWELPQNAIVFGHWLHPAADSATRRPEEVVLCRVGPEVVELHTHGGPAVARSLCETFRQQGIAVVDAPRLWLAQEPGSPADSDPPAESGPREEPGSREESASLAATADATWADRGTDWLGLLEPAWWHVSTTADWVDRVWPGLLVDFARADLPAYPTVHTEGTAAEPDLEATLLWLQSRAAAALAQSQGGTAGQWLWDQLRGALLWEVHEIAVAATTDRAAAATRLDGLLTTWSWGQYLERPIRVLITGPPNVGKSSLINALLGYQRAVVSPIPGTTRDLVQQATVIAGWEFRLTDSAGWRVTTDDLEARGIQKIAVAAADADLILAVRTAEPDASSRDGGVVPCQPTDSQPSEPQPAEPQPADTLSTAAPTMVLLNKIDLYPSTEARVPAAAGTLWPVSARTGQGLDAVVAALVSAVLPAAALRHSAEPESAAGPGLRPPAAVIFCGQVYEWLREWRQRLDPTSPGQRT